MADIKAGGVIYSGVDTISAPLSDDTGNVEFIIPSGSINVTANGTVDVSRYKSVVVNVDSEVIAGGYTVTFMNEGEVYAAYSVLAGNKISSPLDPTKDNYLFDGWGLSESATSYISFPYTPTADVTLYAIFEEYTPCVIEGTMVALADGTSKAIENITYEDDILVWNFYEGKFDSAKPEWIKIEQTTNKYLEMTFSDGAILGCVGEGGEKGYHRIFNRDAGAFTYCGNSKETPVGTISFNTQEEFPVLISQKIVKKSVKYYNLYTYDYYNFFANGILTAGTSLANMYKIQDMRYIGNRLLSDKYIEKKKKHKELFKL